MTTTTISHLKIEDIGKWITYISFDGHKERGKLKSFDNTQKIAWVVYSCDGNWNKYKDYTGESTAYVSLFF